PREAGPVSRRSLPPPERDSRPLAAAARSARRRADSGKPFSETLGRGTERRAEAIGPRDRAPYRAATVAGQRASARERLPLAYRHGARAGDPRGGLATGAARRRRRTRRRSLGNELETIRRAPPDARRGQNLSRREREL